ncbi:MAG: transport-associated protein [Gammaproteobacteria bacterium]|nr:transport-associated protein [Gammaproteobacteria bacterium]
MPGSAPSALQSLFLLILLSAVFGIAGCEQQGPAEEAGQKIDQTAEDAGDKMDEAKQSLTE